MQVLVTRPALQAGEWVQRLRSHGVEALALPLIAILPVEPGAAREAIDAAWRELGQQRLVIFVSPNAAVHFFMQRPFMQRPVVQRPADAHWPEGVLAASPGPGTTQALRELGVPMAQLIEPAADAARFDSEALWVQLQHHDWHAAKVLIVRGEGGRDWLAETLKRHGAAVDDIAAYRRAVPRFDDPEAALLQAAIAAPARFVWFFSSAEAIDNLVAIAGPAAAAAWQRSTAIASHPRIAEKASACGFARVVPTRPTLPAVVACIQSLRPGTGP